MKRLEKYRETWANLAADLIKDIADDYRASDDPEDDTPGMCLTIGYTPEKDSWSYQTGDNSFTGGAYGHPHWAVISLYRDTIPADAAEEIIDQLAEVCELPAVSVDGEYVEKLSEQLDIMSDASSDMEIALRKALSNVLSGDCCRALCALERFNKDFHPQGE